jgi:hypothetical protein
LPPTKADLGFANGDGPEVVNGSKIVNGHTEDLTNGHTNGLTNGHQNGVTNGNENGLTNGHVNGSPSESTNGTEDSNAVHPSHVARVDSPVEEADSQITNGLNSRGTVELAGDWKAFDPIESPPKLIPFSAFDEEGCNRAAKKQAEFLTARLGTIPSHEESTYLNDLAHTMSQRSKLAWRSHVLARSLVDLETRLASPLPKPLRARTNVNVAWYGA